MVELFWSLSLLKVDSNSDTSAVTVEYMLHLSSPDLPGAPSVAVPVLGAEDEVQPANFIAMVEKSSVCLDKNL